MTDSGARMDAFECPICAPKRYFVTEIGLRTHVADRHPWRSLPPAQSRIAPARAALPEPAWLRDHQSVAAAASLYAAQPPSHHRQFQQQQHQLQLLQHQQFGGSAGNLLAVTFDDQSLMSDDVFVDDSGGGGGGGGSRWRQPQVPQAHSRRQHLQLQLRHQQPQASGPQYISEYPPPDYDPQQPVDNGHFGAIDAVDSSTRKRRELATSRRPWYDSEDYEGPRNLMEQPGGYFEFGEPELDGASRGRQGGGGDGGGGGGFSKHRMRRELDDRDSRIETLRLEIDRLWDERMRLLRQEADRGRVVKQQATSAVPYAPLQRRTNNEQQLGHAFQPVLPHSRLQLYRVEQPMQRQMHHLQDRRAMDY